MSGEASMAMRWAVLAMLWAAPAAAQRVAISQARASLPGLTLFLDAEVQGEPALEATLGSRALKVESLRPFDAAREGIAYIVLVDVSKSLGPREFGEVREALRVLAGHLGPRDRMAVIRFADRPGVVSDFTADRGALDRGFAGLGREGEHTALYRALREAIEMGKRRDPDLPERRAAVVLTDGKDEGSGITIDDVLGDLRDNRLPVFAIGFSRLPGEERARYFDLLKRLALDSGGGFFEAADSGAIARAYEDTRNAIAHVLEAHLECTGCTGDGHAQRLAVTLHAGGRVFTDGIDVPVAPAAARPVRSVPAPPSKPAIPLWGYGAAGAVAAGAGALVLRRRGRKQDHGAPAAAPAGDAGQPAAGPPPSPAVRVQFVVVRGERPGASYGLALGRRAVIGTAADSDLRLTSESSVAAHQFELEFMLGRIVIRNLASGQGTLLNGVPLRAQHQVSSGDLISAGNTDLRIVVAS